MSEKGSISRSQMLLTNSSRAYGCPQKYIQGAGEFGNLFAYASSYGDKLLLLVDAGICNMIQAQVDAIEDKHGCAFELMPFTGECCMENVALLSSEIRAKNCNIIVGIGGGKILDIAKLVGDEVNIPRVIVPTSASSDAPAADWAAVYTPEGVHLSGRPTRRSTELVLVDSAIIANAPARLFSAGIGDALATWFEAVACRDAFTPNCVGRGYRSCRIGMAASRECYEILMSDGVSALNAVKAHVVTEAVENVIEANILLSGIGFINGGLAGSHGFHSGFSTVPGCKKYLHGEVVAFGLLCQLVLENASSELIRSTMAFLHETDLPVSLAQIGIERTAENLDKIVNHAFDKNKLIHHEPFAVSKDSMKAAIIAADNMGMDFLARQK